MNLLESFGSSERGRYILLGEMARGGMGVVYLAQSTGPAGFHKLVVIKQLKPELAEDAAFREMFMDEARLAAHLNHRNIVQTNEVVAEGNLCFLVMDYLDGCPLDTIFRRLQRTPFLTKSMQLRIVSEVLAGLHYAHELSIDGKPLGIVHRDISPSNVFFTYDGQVKLIDFGVAKAAGRQQQETKAGVLKGKVAYMAPEQVGAMPVDRRADIFSVGVILRDIVTGERMWGGLSEVDILRKLLLGDIPILPADLDIAPELRAIIDKALALRPDDRYATANDFRVALAAYLAKTAPAESIVDVAEAVSREFERDRQKLAARIEDARKRGPEAGSLPRIGGYQSLATNPQASAPTPTSTPQPRSVTPPAHTETVSGESRGQPTKTGVGRYALFGGVALTAVVSAGVAMALTKRSSDDGAGKATGVAAASASTAPSVQAAAPVAPVAVGSPAPPSTDSTASRQSVVLSIGVIPANAQVFIDDVEVRNLSAAKYARGGTHQIRAVAAGYQPRVETIEFGSNQVITWSLEKTVIATPSVVVASPRDVDTRSHGKAPKAKPPVTTATKPPPHAPAFTSLPSAVGPAPGPASTPPPAVPAPVKTEPAPPAPPAPPANSTAPTKPKRAINADNPY